MNFSFKREKNFLTCTWLKPTAHAMIVVSVVLRLSSLRGFMKSSENPNLSHPVSPHQAGMPDTSNQEVTIYKTGGASQKHGDIFHLCEYY